MSGPSDDWFAPPSGPPAPPEPQPQPQPQPPSPGEGRLAVPGGPPVPDFRPPGSPAAPATSAAPAAGPPALRTPGQPGAYPPDPYYAPGWAAPVPAAAPPRRTLGRVVWIPLAAVVVVGLVVGAVLGVGYWLDRRPLGTVDAATTVPSSRIGTGHCLQGLPPDGDVAEVTVVPCDEPHAAEVVGSRELSFGTWPGSKQAADELARWCEMDNAEQEAGFHAVVWTPSAESWRQGDRTGLCLAALDDGTATGSFTTGDRVTTG